MQTEIIAYLFCGACIGFAITTMTIVILFDRVAGLLERPIYQWVSEEGDEVEIDESPDCRRCGRVIESGGMCRECSHYRCASWN